MDKDIKILVPELKGWWAATYLFTGLLAHWNAVIDFKKKIVIYVSA